MLIDYGMSPVFPDRSETAYSFQKPKEAAYINGFTMNPQPNMNIFSRPFAKTTIEPRYTEYQLKFKMPDASKMERLPWLRKW